MGIQFGVEMKLQEIQNTINLIKKFKEPPTTEMCVAFICLKIGKAKKMAEEMMGLLSQAGIIEIKDGKVYFVKELEEI